MKIEYIILIISIIMMLPTMFDSLNQIYKVIKYKSNKNKPTTSSINKLHNAKFLTISNTIPDYDSMKKLGNGLNAYLKNYLYDDEYYIEIDTYKCTIAVVPYKFNKMLKAVAKYQND